MKARVKDDFFMNTAQSAGLEFVKSEFRFVPDDKIAEIERASFLEILVEHEINASDVAVELAEANGIDLRIVEGSGKDGKIIKSDVEKLMKSAKPEKPVEPAEVIDNVPETDDDVDAEQDDDDSEGEAAG